MFVPVDVPIEVPCCSFVYRRGHGGEVRGDVVFEPPLTNEAHQLLQLRNPHDARAAKRFQGIVRKLAFADIAARKTVPAPTPMKRCRASTVR